MERGDIANWIEHRVVVVLEGAIAEIPQAETPKKGLFRNRHPEPGPIPPATGWGWSISAMKSINDKVVRQGIPVDVVTFLGPEVADEAADWLAVYGVNVASVEAVDFTAFCESLRWRVDIHHVIDSDPRRLDHYGVRAFSAARGSVF
jgi:hypothetical protein